MVLTGRRLSIGSAALALLAGFWQPAGAITWTQEITADEGTIVVYQPATARDEPQQGHGTTTGRGSIAPMPPGNGA